MERRPVESPESIAGLETAQKLFDQASGAAKDGNEADSWTPFCAGEIGMVSAPGWIKGLIKDPKTGCPDTYGKQIGVFALPGHRRQARLRCCSVAPTSRSRRSRQNQELAQKAVALMLSDDYQTILAENGLTPAKNSLAPLLGDDEFAQATIAAASNAKLTPAAPGWANVEGSRVLEDLFSAIAQGGDVDGAGREGRRADEQPAQRLTPDRTRSHTARHGRGGANRRPGRAMPTGSEQDDRPEGGPMTDQLTAVAPSAARRTALAPYAAAVPAPAVPAVLALVVALGYPLVRQVVLSFQEFGLAQQFGQPAGVDRRSHNYRDLLTDPYLWRVTLRSLVFCLVNAAVTMAIGVGLALLMRHMAKPVRILLQIGLLLAWAMPVVAVAHRLGVALRHAVRRHQLPADQGSALDYEGHSWLLEPLSFFFVATVIVVWMSVPFVAFTVYAALTQVPEELVEAAEIDGAGPVAAAAPHRAPEHPAGAARRRPAPGDLGPAGLHADLHPAEGRRQHPRHQPARHLHLPARHRRREVRHGGRGRDLHARADRRPHRAVRPRDAQAGRKD